MDVWPRDGAVVEVARKAHVHDFSGALDEAGDPAENGRPDEADDHPEGYRIL